MFFDQVYEKVLLISGDVGDPLQTPMDGNLTVHHDKDGQAFPATNWPVSDSYFKALVYLSPGWNKIRFDFTSPKLISNGSGPYTTAHSSYISINYLPLNNAPPLQLVVLVGKDSPCTFDAPPHRREREGNGLDIAIRKFRMAAHLWQAFTTEQMYRNNFGRRCFRFEEEWQTGTLSIRDWEVGRMKNEIKIHVVRSDKTVAELRSLDYAQQYGPATKKGELYSLTADAVKRHFRIRPGQKQYVVALLLDAHWDAEVGTITGHAALGGTSDDLQLAVFGSQALQSYPSCIEEVVPAFTDCTPTDTRYVANDCNESGSSWEAANIGMGAHLHEVGHLLGCPHQESGVMLRDYVTFNRTFLVREPYSTRTKSPGLRICRQEDECNWHRLDVLRFRSHPCFRVPSDEHLAILDDSIQFYPVGNGKILFLAQSGISFIEIFVEGEELCKAWLEYINTEPRSGGMPRQVILTEADLRAKLPEDKKKKKLKLEIFSGGSRNLTIPDVAEVLSKAYIINLPLKRQAPKKDEVLTINTLENVKGLGRSFETRQGFKSKKLGFSQLHGSEPQEVVFDSTTLQTKLMTSIKVHSGSCVDGIEFCYEDGHSQLFGKRGGKPGGDEFFFGKRPSGFPQQASLTSGARHAQRRDSSRLLCARWVVDRRSRISDDFWEEIWYLWQRRWRLRVSRAFEITIDSADCARHTLITPRGHSLAGVSGSCGQWIDGFQIIITR